MNIEQQIRLLAARGESKSEVRRILELTHYQMNLYCEAMPDIKWPAQGKSNGNRRYYDSLKECPNLPAIRDNIKKAQEVWREKMAVHEMCGVKGSITQIYNLWSEYITVGRQTVTRRLAAGWGMYDALFKPKQADALDISKDRRRKMVRARELGVNYDKIA